MTASPTSRTPSGIVPVSAPESAACAFVGILDAEGRTEANEAYSPAGTQFQESLLKALTSTSLDVTRVYALRPTPSFPKTKRLIVASRSAVLCDGIATSLLPFINFGPLKTITSGFALFPRLIAWAWRERRRRRVLLLYNLYSPPGIVSVVAGWVTRTAVVAIVADLQIPGDGLLPSTPLRRLDFLLQVRTLPLFDGLVVLTRAAIDDFAPDVPFIEVEGAVPESLMSPLQMEGKTDHSRCILMYAGGLSELKGVPELLAAFAMLDNAQLELWITGRGPLEGMVHAAAARDARITYWGFPSEAKLHELYGRADILVNPHSASIGSARYLFPSKLIEYMATGLPVVSTCSTPELRARYGEFAVVSCGNGPADLAADLRRVANMSSAERSTIGRNGRSFVIQEKSWHRQAARISSFVSTLLEDRKAHRA